jgi:8-oxo-dGTP pyrophosphatase MutT (NUDIX family)
VLSPENRVLLFSFNHKDDALSGKSYWATPGGGLELNESFEQAALRELREETGLTRSAAGPQVASRSFTMMLPCGETVLAEEHFLLFTQKNQISIVPDGAATKKVIHAHRWWTLEELRHTNETIFPLDLIIDILADQLIGSTTISPP